MNPECIFFIEDEFFFMDFHHLMAFAENADIDITGMRIIICVGIKVLKVKITI